VNWKQHEWWRGCSARSANTAKIACAWRWKRPSTSTVSTCWISPFPDRSSNVAVPDALAAYVVEAGRASDHDHLLLADGAVHE